MLQLTVVPPAFSSQTHAGALSPQWIKGLNNKIFCIWCIMTLWPNIRCFHIMFKRMERMLHLTLQFYICIRFSGRDTQCPLNDKTSRFRGRETYVLNYTIALKFGRHIGSTAVDTPAKFQSDLTTSTPTLASSRLREIWSSNRLVNEAPVDHQAQKSPPAMDTCWCHQVINISCSNRRNCGCGLGTPEKGVAAAHVIKFKQYVITENSKIFLACPLNGKFCDNWIHCINTCPWIADKSIGKRNKQFL